MGEEGKESESRYEMMKLMHGLSHVKSMKEHCGSRYCRLM